MVKGLEVETGFKSGKGFGKDAGAPLGNAGMKDLGFAKKVVVNRFLTKIFVTITKSCFSISSCSDK